MDDKCVFCNQLLNNGEPTVSLTEKGVFGIRKAAIERDNILEIQVGQSVHVSCRRDYCSPKNLASVKHQPKHRKVDYTLRSTESTFRFDEHCVFCGQTAKWNGKKREKDVFSVRTSEFDASIRGVCQQRNDSWAQKVLARIESATSDLHAADTIYHQICSVNFRTGKEVPQTHSVDFSKKCKSGRPTLTRKTDAFEKVVEYLIENDEEQITLHDLVAKMQEFIEDDNEAYSTKWLKEKLQGRFGDNLFIYTVPGKQSVVTLRWTAASILHDFFSHPKNNDLHSEKMRIIHTAARLIKNDIKMIEPDNDFYPQTDSFSSTEETMLYVPETLQIFLSDLFVGRKVDLKLVSIAQAIIQATRPRALVAPLQIGLGVQMHHHFASKFLIDSLHAHGFSSSYREVQKFERSAAVTKGNDIPGYIPGNFVQYAADNVDHNSVTLDGLNTFHGMGIIAAVTPKTRGMLRVPKITVTADDIAKAGRVNLKVFQHKIHAFQFLTYQVPHVPELENGEEGETKILDLIWKISWPLRTSRPNWSGMMQTVYREGHNHGSSSIVFLPIVDLNPSDMTCIYSTLQFIASHARKLGVTPVITFDQPLYWKALQVVLNEPSESDIGGIVLRLGGLHIIMSFMGSIGHIMAGSGLHEILQEIYAPNVINHMLSGKAMSRARRGHFLVDTALHALLMSKIFCVPLPGIEKVNGSSEEFEHPSKSDLEEICSLYDQLMSGEIGSQDLSSSEILQRIISKIEAEKKSLMTQRTARLWLQYMEMLDILRSFIRAERISDWKLHLNSVSRMIPYFAASGHYLYAKSCNVYLQMMLKLPIDHPDVQRNFQNGYHSIRRSDRFWAGLSSDLIIEQMLMRSMKTTGGLTRGRGMSETQRLTWLLSMPSCASVNNVMQNLTDVTYDTSDQHKDTSLARVDRDSEDIKTLIRFLEPRNPFAEDDTLLRSIDSGVVASNDVNVDEAREVGMKIIDSMKTKRVSEYTFKRKDRVITLAAAQSVKIGSERIQIEPQLLFQRLIIAAKGISEDIASFMKYELCSHPPALADKSGLLREANKPVLADTIWKLANQTAVLPKDDVCYIVDGGYLLQKIPWPRGLTYLELCHLYSKYLSQRYQRAVVVFDGYESGPGTKDETHTRRMRKGGRVSPLVHFQENTVFKGIKTDFLRNSRNKQNFINLLSQHLLTQGFSCKHANEDADTLIVQTAVECSNNNYTIVIGEDTDLLILLCFHSSDSTKTIFFTSDTKSTARQPARIWDVQDTRSRLGEETCKNLLFIHAFVGCDTTSQIYGIGKGTALTKIMRSKHFRQQADIFNRSNAPKDEVIAAGEKAFVCLYNGPQGTALNQLRHQRFCEKVAKSLSFVEPKTLPPTEDATSFHSMRVYLQIQQWKGNYLDPTEWGWVISEGSMKPILMKQQPAPEEILHVVRCKCSTNCATASCSCKRHSLPCSAACGECHGIDCYNAIPVDLDMQ